jgi:hypothetical protein
MMRAMATAHRAGHDTPLDAGERRERLAGALYGLVAVGAVLALASEDDDPSVIHAAEFAVATVLAFWLAHGWADALASRAYDREHRWHVRRSLARHAGIILAAIPPILIMFVVRLLGSKDGTAETVGAYSAVVLLGVWGGVIARREEATWFWVGVSAAGSALLGTGVVVLKALAH